MSEWISIKLRLPEPHQMVLVHGDDGIFRAYRDRHDEHPGWQCSPIGSYAGDGCVFGITHWMPLPEPPKKHHDANDHLPQRLPNPESIFLTSEDRMMKINFDVDKYDFKIVLELLESLKEKKIRGEGEKCSKRNKYPSKSRNKYLCKNTNGKKKRLHRIVMEEYLGRPLKDNEHVYHINNDPIDNRIENLVVIVRNIYDD